MREAKIPEDPAAPSERSVRRSEYAAAVGDETGIGEALIALQVRRFYAAARRDPVLGPVFVRVTDWEVPSHSHHGVLVVGCADDRAVPRQPARRAPPAADQRGAFRPLARALERDRRRDLPTFGRGALRVSCRTHRGEPLPRHSIRVPERLAARTQGALP